MIKPNAIITTTTGRQLQIGVILGMGTEGSVAKAKDMVTHKIMAVKLFHPERCTPDTLARLKFLCAQELHKIGPALVVPRDIISGNGMVGYVMDFVDGVCLQTFLETTPVTFMQRLICLARIVHALSRLHAKGISHGDIRQANVLIRLDGDIPVIHIIDFDNFNAKGIPGPTCLGDEMYLAPEQHQSMKAGKPVAPDIGSDRYAIRVMAEELLTLRHLSSGYHEPDERFEYAMYECWVHDPACPTVPGVGGYPPAVLNARVANLFRRGMSRDPSKRPELTEWVNELVEAMNEVFICPSCHKSCLVDVSKLHCPYCRMKYPVPCLNLPDGRKLTISEGLMQVGRGELGADNRVSAIHAVLRRIGPLVSLESFGMNGTYRKTGDSWVRLENRKPIILSAEDVLRFAHLEAKVDYMGR